MISSATSSSSAFLSPIIFQYDCETDGIDVNTANMSEVCLSVDKVFFGEKNYFVAYMKKPACANYPGPYQKIIPASSKRHSSATCLSKMFHFINTKIKDSGIAILMGYNVKNWDEPVLQKNCTRFSVMPPMERLKFFDIADVAHHLGYPMGTTQQQLEAALRVDHLPANRHRAHADVKVVKQIWQRMVQRIEGNQEKLAKLNTALINSNAELEVSKVLIEYDPSLLATEEAIERILTIKEEEKTLRENVFVLFDTETTGLLPKERRHHDSAIRILELGAKILSPYSGDLYNETFVSLVNPGVPIPPDSTAIHGIRNEDIAGKPNIKEAFEAFELWVRTSNTYKRILRESEIITPVLPRIILVGYNNAHYDNVILTEEVLLSGVDLKRQLNKQVKGSYDVMMLMSTWYTGQATKPPTNKLQDHARFLGIPEHDAHRALGDVETLDRVLKKICGPINPTLVISEAIHFPNEPGKSAKAIIKGALELLAIDMEPKQAVQEAVQMYEDSLKTVSNKPEPSSSRKKQRVEESQPDSQAFLVQSQNLDGQVVYI